MRATSSVLNLRVQNLNEIPVVEKRLYFAYGSNLQRCQMLSRCPEYQLKGTAVLANYRVVCNKKGSNGVEFYAGIIPSLGDDVLGALYQLTPTDLSNLDRREGFNGKGMHYTRNGEVFWVKNRKTGENVNAFTYTVASPVAPKKPTPEYAQIILEGCRDHDFPEEYTKNLRRWFLMEPETA